MLRFGGLIVNSVGVLNSFILCVLCFVARLICLGVCVTGCCDLRLFLGAVVLMLVVTVVLIVVYCFKCCG